jgi:DNA-binding CsgD family transcriptional regulator
MVLTMDQPLPIMKIGPRQIRGMRISIMQDLADGLTTEQIAVKICRTRGCVFEALKKMRRMNGCKTNFELLAMAVKNGVVK